MNAIIAFYRYNSSYSNFRTEIARSNPCIISIGIFCILVHKSGPFFKSLCNLLSEQWSFLSSFAPYSAPSLQPSLPTTLSLSLSPSLLVFTSRLPIQILCQFLAFVDCLFRFFANFYIEITIFHSY